MASLTKAALFLVTRMLPFLTTKMQLPPQCDPTELLMPQSLDFMGTEVNVTMDPITFSTHRFGPLSPNLHQHNPLLLINGFGALQYDWPIPFLQSLAQTRELIIFDNPGVARSSHSLLGNSDTPPSSTTPNNKSPQLSIEHMSDLVSLLIQNLNLTRRPDILGFSMGGMISLTLAARHPTVISNNVIIISGSYGGKGAPQPAASIDATLQKMVPVFLSRYDPAKQNHTEEYDDSLFELYFPKGAADLGVCGLWNHVVTLMWAQARGKISPQALIVSNSTLQAQATAIKTFFNQKSPTQAAMALKKRQFAFITGDSDAIIPAETSKKAVDASLPGSWHVKIPQAGHSLLYSHSSQIASIVLHYLDSNHAIIASS